MEFVRIVMHRGLYSKKNSVFFIFLEKNYVQTQSKSDKIVYGYE